MTEETIPESVLEMQKMAEADEDYQKRCIFGEKVFYVAADKAFIPGHIYSIKGMDEYLISYLCEYHFDEITLPEDDDDA